MTDSLDGLRRFHSPICFSCVHFKGEPGRMTCSAYPLEIPDKIVFGNKHNEVEYDQAGTDVFTEIVWLEDDTPSLSMCAECRHRRIGGSCTAYPDGIPDRWLFTIDVHTAVASDQHGSATFEPRRAAQDAIG